MGVDVIIVGTAEDIASRPSDETMEWIEDRLEDYNIRYGYVALEESDVARLRGFPGDPVRDMLVKKVDALRAENEGPPYLIELMISA